MASILKVDDLRGNTAAGNITITSEGGAATMQLQQGVAKCWCSLDGTGTISVRDSFNTTSLTDNGTANYSVNIDNSMSSDGYVPTGSVVASSSSNYYSYITSAGSTSHIATGSLTFRVVHNTGAFPDLNRVHVSIDGDLA